MNVKLVSYSIAPRETAALGAGICTKAVNSSKALETAMASGHESVLEHANFTFRIMGISRVTLAQLTRHRIASFSVQSQRYVDQSDTAFIVPDTVIANKDAFSIYTDALETVQRTYHDLLELNIPKEDARYILPEGTTTELLLTMNARELRHFFYLRCCNKAQWEIRELAWEMLERCQDVCPELFKDAGPGCLRGSCPEARPCGKPVKEMK